MSRNREANIDLSAIALVMAERPTLNAERRIINATSLRCATRSVRGAAGNGANGHLAPGADVEEPKRI